MAFSEEDKVVIKFLRQNNNYGAKMFLNKYPDKGWTLGRQKYLIRKIDRTGSSKRRKYLRVAVHVEIRLFISGVFVSELVSRPMVDVLNTDYSSIIIQNQVVLGILKNDGYLLVFLIIIAGGRNILGHSV